MQGCINKNEIKLNDGQAVLVSILEVKRLRGRHRHRWKVSL